MSAPAILQSTATGPRRCRCGTWVGRGDRMYQITPDSSFSGHLFDGQVFCSGRCVRAFCLESLETMDAIDTPAATMVVSDLHDAHQELVDTLAAL